MEFLKNRVVVILGVCNIIFLLVAVNSCLQTRRYNDVKRNEEIRRFDAEQELNKITLAKTAVENKLQETEAALSQGAALLETTQKSLLQEQLINKSLKAELDKLRKLNSALEQDLKNTLGSGKSAKPEK